MNYPHIGFWWFMFFMNLLYPVSMILGGLFMSKTCPKQPNGFSGYRSHRSKINQDTWSFANKNCGQRWYKLGLYMLIPLIAVQLPFLSASEETIGTVGLVICAVGCSIMLLSILPTEKALKETFNDDGTRKPGR